jgi:hypothetical protein
MLFSCFYFGVPVKLLGCQAGTHAAGRASGSIWATDVPGWITALATVGLLAGAIVTARYAIKAFGKQSEELATLQEERRMAQAARVYVTAPRDKVRLVHPSAANGSDLPIHDTQIWYADPGGLSGPEDLGIVLPGEAFPARRSFSAADVFTYTVLTFRDAFGVRWIRMPDGTLKGQTRPTARDSILAVLEEASAPAPDYEQYDAAHARTRR